MIAENTNPLYRRLTKNRLDEFHRDGVPLFSIGPYSVKIRDGFHEHEGGLCLMITTPRKMIVQVGGRLQPQTNVIAIQGRRHGCGSIDSFRERTGVHPANLALLLYLQLSKYLDHDDVVISGNAKDTFYNENVQSAFYEIPRNHFRLRTSRETGDYEFDATTRDKILTKFAAKHATVRNAFVSMESYLREQ